MCSEATSPQQKEEEEGEKWNILIGEKEVAAWTGVAVKINMGNINGNEEKDRDREGKDIGTVEKMVK